MGRRSIIVVVALSALGATGCFGIGEAAGKRSGALAADHYLKYYAVPEAEKQYADDPAAKKEFQKQAKQTRREVRDTIVR